MLCVWGCTAYVLIQRDKRPLRSLGTHMEKCIFIGYPPAYKGWKFYSPRSKKVMISERAELMSAISCLRVTLSPTTLPLALTHSLSRLPPPLHCQTFWMTCWMLQKLQRSQFMRERVLLFLICLLLRQFRLQALQLHSKHPFHISFNSSFSHSFNFASTFTSTFSYSYTCSHTPSAHQITQASVDARAMGCSRSLQAAQRANSSCRVVRQ